MALDRFCTFTGLLMLSEILGVLQLYKKKDKSMKKFIFDEVVSVSPYPESSWFNAPSLLSLMG